MGKRRAADAQLGVRPGPAPPSSPPPESPAKGRQLGGKILSGPRQGEAGPTTFSETDAGNAKTAFSFRLDSKDAPPPATFFEVNTRGPNPWSFSKFAGVTITMEPYGAPSGTPEKAEAPGKAAPAQEKVAATPKAAEAVPQKPEVEAKASASTSAGAAQATPAVSAPLRAPAPKIALVQTKPMVWTPAPASYFEAGVGQLVGFSIMDPASWEHLVGLYVQESGRTPLQVGLTTLDGAGLLYPVQELGRWIRDWRRVDEWEKSPTVADCWPQPAEGSITALLCRQIGAGIHQQILEEAIRRWAIRCPSSVEGVVRRAGYMLKYERAHEYSIMSAIKKMAGGAERERLVGLARRESPRFAEECMMDEYCGM